LPPGGTNRECEPRSIQTQHVAAFGLRDAREWDLVGESGISDKHNVVTYGTRDGGCARAG